MTSKIHISNYSPFGVLLQNRNFTSERYRYGFNGQEKDDEVAGSGNSYTAEFWQYDPRLGRRWNIDPMFFSFPWQSPYSTFNNNPIRLIDPKGLAAGDPPKDGDIRSENGTNYMFNASSNFWDVLLDEVEVVTQATPTEKAMGLIYLFEQDPNTPTVFNNIPKADVVADLRARVQSGGMEITQSENTCGMAALGQLFCSYDPVGYVQFTLDLYQYGEASYNDYTIGANEGVANWAANATPMSNGRGGTMGGADLVFIGSMRFVENTPNGFSNGGWSGITWPGEVSSIAGDLIGLKQIYPNGSMSFKIQKSSDMMAAGNQVYAMYMYPVGFFAYHYQTFGGVVPNSNPQEIYYWDYGSSTWKTKQNNIIGFGSQFWIFVPK